MLKRYALPSALILLLAGSFAIAQTINRAVQLSQDTSGAFSVDTNNGLYLPNHLFFTGRTPTIAGTATPTIRGSDSAGAITMGTNATTAIATFARAWLSTPYCIASTNTQMLSPIAVGATTTTMSITQVSTSGNIVNYFCTSSS